MSTAEPDPRDADLLTASPFELARQVRAGEVTSAELVEVFARQVAAVNPALNLVVASRLDEAREEAAAADTRHGEPGLPPLHGVPCSIKETFALTGMPWTAGLVARRHVRAERDAVTVARLRAAGAIPLGVTNTSELAMWMESYNKVWGRSRNPYDPARVVGGSSGGEAAAVSACLAPFGLGSDIGGSIRMPAFFNGVFGHKPTGGIVSNDGQYPLAENDALRFMCTGPLCRDAADLMPLLRIIAGDDPAAAGHPLGDPAEVDLDGLPVVVVPGDGLLRVDRELLGAQRRAADALRRRGARVTEASLPALRRGPELWAAMMQAARDTPFRELLADGQPWRPLREVGRYAARRSPHTLAALGLALVERLPELLPRRNQALVARARALREEVTELVGDGVLLYPPYPDLAPRHSRPLRLPLKWVYTGIWNVLETPVTAVPLGLSGEGLPLGVQVVGGHGRDHVTIAVAHALEQALGGWVAPPVVPRVSALTADRRPRSL